MTVHKHKRVEALLLLGLFAFATGSGAWMFGVPPTGSVIALVVIGLVLCARAAWRIACRVHHERVVVVGASRLAGKLVQEIEARPELGWSVAWLTGAGDQGRGARLARAILAHRPDRILIDVDERWGQLPIAALLNQKAQGAILEEASAAYERITGKVALEALRPSDVLFGRAFRVSLFHRFIARLLGIVAALVGFLVGAPVFLIVAAAIKLDSAGPVFFRQPRLGRGGRPFALVKFRTMHPVPGLHSEWERDNLDRLTRVGRVLRRFRLDELPQLWNVLKGDMDLVGPRPHPVSNADLFARSIPYYELRLLVRPGITGWAQVHYGYANNLEEETEKMRYDLYYLKHRSLWLDLSLLPATLRVAIVGSGTEVAAESEPHPLMAHQSHDR